MVERHVVHEKRMAEKWDGEYRSVVRRSVHLDETCAHCKYCAVGGAGGEGIEIMIADEFAIMKFEIM